MIRKAILAACTVLATGMAVLGLIRPETAYDPNADTPNYQLWLGDGFLFVTIQRDLGNTATWTGVQDGDFPGFVFGRIHAWADRTR